MFTGILNQLLCFVLINCCLPSNMFVRDSLKGIDLFIHQAQFLKITCIYTDWSKSVQRLLLDCVQVEP